MSEARFCWCPEHGRVRLEDVRMYFDERVKRLTFVEIYPYPDGEVCEGEEVSSDSDLKNQRVFHYVGDHDEECAHHLDLTTYTDEQIKEFENKLILGYCSQCCARITDVKHLEYNEHFSYEVTLEFDKDKGENKLARELKYSHFGYIHGPDCGGRVEIELDEVLA